MRIACIAVAAAIGVVALCGGPGDAEARSDCAPRKIRAGLVSFVEAYNRGDSERLDTLFAAEPDFEWYSTDSPGERLGREAKRRTTLIPYLRRRHALDDRFALRSFGFNGNAARYGNFEMWMRRRVDGYRGGDWFRVRGKGAAICRGDAVRFIVLTFGTVPAGAH